MKNKVCSIFFSKSASIFLMFIAFPDLVGLKHWTRTGWHQPNIKGGVFLSIIALLIFLYNKRYCREPIVYKCLDCKEVFDETKIENKECPYCKSKKIISIDKYYGNYKYTNDSLSYSLYEIFLFIVISFPIFYVIYTIAGIIFGH